MSTINNLISVGITLSTAGTYTSPLTVTSSGTVANSSGDAIYGPGYQGWTVDNYGTIAATGTLADGVRLMDGGAVSNGLSGASSAYIYGTKSGVYITGAAGTVTNAGTILSTGTAGYGVNLTSGSIGNTGLIEGAGGVGIGVGIGGVAGTVTNSGTILGTGTSGRGVALGAGGSVGNTGAGLIEGYSGVYIRGVAGTVTNSGTIHGTGTSGIGVFLASGGTVVDSGRISGAGTAIGFGGTGGNRLVLDPGYALGGVVTGSAAVGATNTLELAASAGTVVLGLGGEFVNIGTLRLDAGAQAYGSIGIEASGLAGASYTIDNSGRISTPVPGTAGQAIQLGSLANLVGDSLITNESAGNIFGFDGGFPGTAVQIFGAGTVVNNGAIFGEVYVYGTGTVSNSGSIGRFGTTGGGTNNGIILAGGGSVDNAGSARIDQYYAIQVGGAGGTVTNAGTIHSGQTNGNYAVKLLGGGYVANTATTALISGYNGVFLGAAGSVSNAGAIIDSGFFGSPGVYLTHGGGVDNTAATSLIYGIGFGARITSGLGVVTNSGTIASGFGPGIDLGGGGTVVDSGTITGVAYAISFYGYHVSSDNLLVIEAGYSLTGRVRGGGTGTNTAELSGAAGAATADYNGLSLSNFGTIAFGPASGASEIWKITNDATLPGTISGFVSSFDTIDLAGFAGGTVLNGGSVNGSDQLLVSNGGGTVTLQLDPGEDDSAITWTAASDGNVGTDVFIACFRRGTMIGTPAGETAVEALKIGDEVMTLAGEAAPVRWIGHRAYNGRFVARNEALLPICVRAGALGDGVPARDLHVSPAHALHIDGLLVPAEFLLNGTTISQAESVEEVEYFHVELDAHQVIFAEGAAAESFVDCDNRMMFANAGDYARLYPDDARPRWAYCGKRLEWDSPELLPIRSALLRRAAAEDGHRRAAEPDLHLVVDRAVVRPYSSQGRTHRFDLPGAVGELWIASRRVVPSEVVPASRDKRRLGVPIERIALWDADLLIEAWHGHAALSDGFHDDEATHRWTSGRARLPAALLRPFAGPFTLELRLVPSELPYRLPAAASGEAHLLPMAGARAGALGTGGA